MSAAVLLDGRCRPLRRTLSPAAWMILEEAALCATDSEGGDLWVPLSIRAAADATGLGRESTARAIAALVSAGLLRRSQTSRTPGGRFRSGGYWLVAPPGLTATGIDRSSASGEPGLDEPCPVVPATVAVDDRGGTKDRRRGVGHRSEPQPVAARQASLFAAGVGEEGPEHVAVGGTPRAVVESVGAVSSVGCEVVDRVHELAPGVPAGADPGVDPHPMTGGDARC